MSGRRSAGKALRTAASKNRKLARECLEVCRDYSYCDWYYGDYISLALSYRKKANALSRAARMKEGKL